MAFAAALLIFAARADAQASAQAYAKAYEGRACHYGGNPALQHLSFGAVVPELLETTTGDFIPWATSTLLPQMQEHRPKTDGKLNASQERFDQATCRYSAQRAADKNPRSGWCESAPGPGIFEVLVVRLENPGTLLIRGGLERTAGSFRANARPRAVRLFGLVGQSEAVKNGWRHRNLKVVAVRKAELKDINEAQEIRELPWPSISKGESRFIAIQILSVYPGDSFEDTCISEVSNAPPDSP
jgi:hypothetical protein